MAIYELQINGDLKIWNWVPAEGIFEEIGYVDRLEHLPLLITFERIKTIKLKTDFENMMFNLSIWAKGHQLWSLLVSPLFYLLIESS